MKYCNYCGYPIDEPARFCPKCGHQLPLEIANAQFQTEEARSQNQTKPQRFSAYGVPISEPAQASAVPQIRTNSEKRNGMGSVKALLWICLIVTVGLFAYLNSIPTGIEDTWKMTLDLNEMDTMLGTDASAMVALGLDKADLKPDLNEDHTMALNITMSKGKICAKGGLTGTYEFVNGGNLRLNLKEETFYMYAYGYTTEDTQEVDGSIDFEYHLNGNTLTLTQEGVDDMVYEFKRS